MLCNSSIVKECWLNTGLEADNSKTNNILLIKNPAFGGTVSLDPFLEILSPYKTTIQNRLMFPRKIGVTPIFEFLYLLGYQHFDGLAQFLFKEPRIKTHPCENVLCITKHLHNKKMVSIWF